MCFTGSHAVGRSADWVVRTLEPMPCEFSSIHECFIGNPLTCGFSHVLQIIFKRFLKFNVQGLVQCHFCWQNPRIGHAAVTTLGYPIVTHLGRAMQRINVILEHFQSLAIINLHWRWQRTGFGWAQFGFGRMSSYRVGSGSRNRLRRRPNICQPNIFRVVQKIETLTTMCVPTC
jgi:hypothetical protein